LLSRFAVRLDYENRALTLTPAGDFHYGQAGTRVPLFFADNFPVIPAAADGITGRFEIDTGSSESIVLQRRFVEQYGFERRHPGGPRMKVGGADGVFETIAARLDRFTVANAEIQRPVAEFPSGGRNGLPVAHVDGSIGYQILRQFVITFDYSRRELWFERSAAFGMKTVQWKTGFQAVKADGPGFNVVTVLPDTPAATAGISVGDIITVIDGRPAASVGQAEFSGLMRGPDGTLIHLGMVRDGTPRLITLTLKELLP
jgi:PDZ domain/Aspartyl protease